MSLLSEYRRWRNYRHTVNALERLSDRQLGDVGIDRSSIRKVARDYA